MATVTITPAALEELGQLPLTIQARVRFVFARLEQWPAVSGAKPLRGDLAGNFRIRTGDYRVIFKVRGEGVLVWKIGYRGSIYD